MHLWSQGTNNTCFTRPKYSKALIIRIGFLKPAFSICIKLCCLKNNAVYVYFELTGLPLFWTGCKQHDLNLSHVITCLCEAPAKLAGLQKRKGQIAVGMDADFVIWNPDDYTTVRINVHLENHSNSGLDGYDKTFIIKGTDV